MKGYGDPEGDEGCKKITGFLVRNNFRREISLCGVEGGVVEAGLLS